MNQQVKKDRRVALREINNMVCGIGGLNTTTPARLSPPYVYTLYVRNKKPFR